MIQRTLEMQFDKLIIGADLDALRFAYANKIPIVHSIRRDPAEYNLEGYIKNYEEYNLLHGLLGINNLIPFSNLVQTIRYDDANTLNVATKSNLSVTVKFNELYISDDKNIEGLPPVTSTTGDDNLVLDYIDVRSGLYHQYDRLDTQDDLVKTIYFYLSTRFYHKNIDGKKDCVALSMIKSENIEQMEYSEVFTRIKAAKLMKASGIKGRWDKTNQKFKAVRLMSRKRMVYPLWKNLYSDLPKNVHVLYNVPAVQTDKEKINVTSGVVYIYED